MIKDVAVNVVRRQASATVEIAFTIVNEIRSGQNADIILNSAIRHAVSRLVWTLEKSWEAVVGKLKRLSVNANTSSQQPTRWLFFCDCSTNTRYLVDTGADISVLPVSHADRKFVTDLKLHTVNNSNQHLWERQLVLNLGLRRLFRWRFIVANVN